MISDEFIEDLMKLRYKAELDPKGYKDLKDKWTHDLPCEIESEVMKSMNAIFAKWWKLKGKYSREMMSLLKVGVGVEYNSKEVAEMYKSRNETPPAYDLSLRAICTDEDILDVMEQIIMDHKVPLSFHNTWKFIKQCKHRRDLYMKNIKPKVGRLRNGSATRIKNKHNVVDIVGVVYHNDNYKDKAPANILNRLGIIRKEYWDSLDISHFGNTYGMHFIVPGKECKPFREVYAMDPEVQLDGSCIADYMRFIAKGIDTNATLDQYKWIRKCIEENWNNEYWIISTDMEKYSDSLNRKKMISILNLCGILDDDELNEMDIYWGLDVWDRDKLIALINSDSVKQGQYSIFDAMTIANMFVQCIIYDILEESNEYRDKDGKIRNKNSALGDDTVLAFINEQKRGLYVIQEVFGYLGVKISKSKTHIMSRGFDYKDKQLEEPGFIDFAKRMITKDGLLSYISANAISKDNFDDHVMEYFRILEEDPELADWYGRKFLGDRYSFICNLHKINGGRRTDAITDSDMILFEYKVNQMRSTDRVSPHEIKKQLMFIKDQGIMLSNTKLLGWLDDYDGDDLYMPSERDDARIIANIMNYHTSGRDLDFVPSDYVGKTWEEVCEDDVFVGIINTMRIEEKSRSRKKKSKVYDKMSKLNLKDFRHNLFIFEASASNKDGFRDYSDMRYESFVRKLHVTFSRCVASSQHGYVSSETTWYFTRNFLIYKGVEYRLYSLERPRYNSRPRVPLSVFSEICQDCFRNKDMEEIYRAFIDSLPGLSRDDEYYNYFDY